MNIWTITWRYYDGSGSGVFNRAYTDEELARHVLDILQVEGSKEYGLVMMEIIDPTGVLPKPIVKTKDVAVYERVPHQGVKGVTPIDAHMLSVRLVNGLRSEGITTLEQLMCWTEWELLRMPGVGRKALNELKEYLHSKGLQLKGR